LALLILHFTKQSWEFQWHLSDTCNNRCWHVLRAVHTLALATSGSHPSPCMLVKVYWGKKRSSMSSFSTMVLSRYCPGRSNRVQQRRDSHNYGVTSSHAVNHSTGYILTLISNKHMWPFITTFEGNGNIISIYIQCSDTSSSFQQPPMTVAMFCSILPPSRPKDSNLAPLNSLKWSSSILPRGQHFTNRASKNSKHKILGSQHFQTKPNWAAFFEGLHLPWGLAL
jgi:hypothetical protein